MMLRMQQHRALGHAGRAAGVLQERDVVVPDRDRARACAADLPASALGQAHRARQVATAGIIFLTWRSTKSTSTPFKPSISPMLVTTTCLTCVLPMHFRERVREVLDDDDHLGAAVGRADARARAACRAD